MSKTSIPLPYVILLGTQRSGTTLLTRILSSHSQLFIQNEISVDKVFNDSTAGNILERLADQISSRFNLSLNLLLEKEGKIFWGFKDPQLTEHLDKLIKFFETTKYIIILRDPRGVVNSYMDNRWGLGTTAYTGALRWKKEVELQEAFIQKIPDQCLYIRYEDLVSKLEDTLHKVCKHLEIPFEDEMLAFHKKKSQYKLNASNVNTNKETTTHFSIRWKNELSQRQVEEIESVCSELMIRNGYLLTSNTKSPSAVRKLYYHLHQSILGELQIQYQLKRLKVKKLINQVTR